MHTFRDQQRMPRPTDRDFLALAITQNRKAWGTAEAAQESPVTAFEAAADRAQAAWLATRRARLVGRIGDAIDFPQTFNRSPYFAFLGGGLALSADEAVDEFRRLIRREVERCRRRHWSAAPQRVPAMKEALTFARYFRRFGTRLWMRRAA
jgi:hypothetical protein